MNRCIGEKKEREREQERDSETKENGLFMQTRDGEKNCEWLGVVVDAV